MTRSFLVPLLLPADPALPLEAATKQYVDAVGGGGTGDQYQYDWQTTTTATDPGVGKLKCNNANPTLATAVYISMHSDLGRAGLWMLDLAVGSRFAIYELGDINTFIRYEVTALPTNNGPNVWFSIPAVMQEQGVSGFTPSNNQTVQVGPSRAAAAALAYPVAWQPEAPANTAIFWADTDEPAGATRIVTHPETTLTASLADAESYLRFTGTNPVFTFPLNVNVAFPIGTRMEGVGTISPMTIAYEPGVTVGRARGLVTTGAGSAWSAIKVGTDEWDVHGDFT
jgi:hypothetical protein